MSILDQVKVIYEDDNVVIVDKPTGLTVHSDGKRDEPSLVDWVLEKYPLAETVGEPLVTSSGKTIIRAGVVHRLDKETSGVIVVAKNQDSFIYLKNEFKGRKVEKIYHAFVYGNFKEPEGIIDFPMGRSAKDFRRWAVKGTRGEMRDALTTYKVLGQGEGFSFVEIYPKTGRTHQIRVHFKAINHPIVCDGLYAPKEEKILGFQRLALHASKIKFITPNGESLEVEAPSPADFESAIAQAHFV